MFNRNALKARGLIYRACGNWNIFSYPRHIFRHDIYAVTAFLLFPLRPRFPSHFTPSMCLCSLRMFLPMAISRGNATSPSKIDLHTGRSFYAPKCVTIFLHYKVYIFLHCKVWIEARNFNWKRIYHDHICKLEKAENIRSVCNFNCL